MGRRCKESVYKVWHGCGVCFLFMDWFLYSFIFVMVTRGILSTAFPLSSLRC